MKDKKLFWYAVHTLNDYGTHIAIEQYCAELKAEVVEGLVMEYCEKCNIPQYHYDEQCVMCETYNRPEDIYKRNQLIKS